MRRLVHLLLFLVPFACAIAQDSSQVEVVTFEQLQPMLQSDSDTTFVVNFWATWCAPCVKELPHFERLNDESQGSELQVLLVSLDFKHQIQSKLIPFLHQKNIRSRVVFLDAPNPNAWIDLVDPSWSGALPGTLVFRGNARKFYEQSFEEYEDLKSIVQSFYKI